MKIVLVPQRRDDTLEVMKAGDVLTVNGESFDFSLVGDGATLPRAAINSQWFAGDVDRIDGELILALWLPNPLNYSPQQAFPVPLENVPDGLVVFPPPLPDEVVAAQQSEEQESWEQSHDLGREVELEA
ncbi:hypothetical protein [Pseudomonas sp. RT6P73]